jgi:hypothetical protein
MELVEWEELFGRKPAARRDAELSQFSLDAIGMEIERHRCDSAGRDHDVFPYPQNRSLPHLPPRTRTDTWSAPEFGTSSHGDGYAFGG